MVGWDGANATNCSLILASNPNFNDTDIYLQDWDHVDWMNSPSGPVVRAIGLILLGGSIPTEIGLLGSLTTLTLNGANGGVTFGLTGTIPTELANTNLSGLDLGQNHIIGAIPKFVFNMTNFKALSLSNNFLTGTIPTEVGTNPAFDFFLLAYNFLTGTIPTEFGKTSCEVLLLDFNDLSGTIPTELGLISRLNYLTLQNNLLTGTVPTELGSAQALQAMAICCNQFSGTIPTELGKLNLEYLFMQQNLLSGTIPTEFGNCLSLIDFELNNNNLQGTIPTFFGNLVNLTVLRLGTNQLTGTIPSMPALMRELSLPNNQLTGGLDALASASIIQRLYLYSNQLSGNLSVLVNLKFLTDLNLLGNAFSGEVLFDFFLGLQTLDLSFNNFTGVLSVTNCDQLTVLSASNNQFTALEILNGPSIFLINMQSNLIKNVTLTAANGLQSLDLSSNLISSLAIPTGELKYSIFASLPAFKVSLRNNKLTTIPTDFVWSPSIFDLDLSENLITTVPAVLYWISPVLDQFSNDTYCACNVTVLQDPAKRVVDLTANRIPATSATVVELMGTAAPFNYQGPLRANLQTQNCGDKCFGALTGAAQRTNSFTISPQDVDDCALGTHQCQQNCLDGWAPVLGYTCGCNSGYTLNGDLRTCANSNLGLIIGVSVAVPLALLLLLLILLLLLTYCLRKKRSDLNLLPKEIAWSYLEYENGVGKWGFQGEELEGEKQGYYFKECDRSGEEKVYILLENTLGNTGNTRVEVMKIWQVYNKALTTSFINQWRSIVRRVKDNEDLFGKDAWRTQGSPEELARRREVYDQYLGIITSSDKSPWNNGRCNGDNVYAAITLTAHGTDLPIAKLIAQTGFAALSSLDEGFYGKGIYFSTSVLYCFPYYFSRRNPAIIMSWVCLGNTFPVIENHLSPTNSLLGSPLKSGYNSHYIRTDKEGMIYEPTSQSLAYDEIVIIQESQVVPAFILELERSNFTDLRDKFQRATPMEYVNRANVNVERDTGKLIKDDVTIDLI